MTALNTQSFSTIVSNMVAAVQGAASQLIDTSIGSILRAASEAAAGVALWLQGLALQIAATSRLSTSSGTDVDSFGADFGFTRLPAKPSNGQVTLGRFTTTAPATIAVGTVVQTQDGTQQFQLTADATEAAFNATLNAYVIPSSTASITASAQALTAGAASNVAAGLINTLGSSMPGVDTVTNAASFTNGADAETDAAYKNRFVEFIASLAECTPAAVIEAIESVQQNVTESLTENQTYGGASQPGYFYAVVDDGSGNPPSNFLASVFNAVDAVRPIGSVFGIFPPVEVTANIGMTLTTAAGYDHTTLVTAVQNAITAFVNALNVGDDLPYSRLAQIAYTTSPGITNVTGVLLNSGTSDLVTTSQQVIKVGTLTII